MPIGYFPPEIAAAMAEFRDATLSGRDAGLFEYFLSLPSMEAPWRDAATGLYTAWLAQLAARRSRRFGWPKLPLPFPRRAVSTRPTRDHARWLRARSAGRVGLVSVGR